MAGGFRNLMQQGAPPEQEATLVHHTDKGPGGTPSLQERRDELRKRLQRKFDTAPNAAYVEHYGSLLQKLDADSAGSVLHDSQTEAAKGRRGETGELKRLKREDAALRGVPYQEEPD